MADNLPHEQHETRDMSFKTVAGFAIGLLAVLVLIGGALLGLYSYFGTHDAKSDTLPSMVTPPSLPSEPHVEVESSQSIQALNAAADQLLNTYGWSDQQKGIARIPIDRAMQLIVSQGVPVYWQNGKPVYEF